jgi:putative Ca2+/H+ antiporter (TMEM165/GDT1 family)
VSGLLIAAIVFGTITAVELPDNSGLASLVLGTRYRPIGVFAGTAAAFAMHAVLAVTAGSLLALLPHKIVEIAVAVVFLAGAALVLRADNDDDDKARLKADAAGFWPVAASRLAALVMVVMAAVTLGEAIR